MLRGEFKHYLKILGEYVALCFTRAPAGSQKKRWKNTGSRWKLVTQLLKTSLTCFRQLPFASAAPARTWKIRGAAWHYVCHPHRFVGPPRSVRLLDRRRHGHPCRLKHRARRARQFAPQQKTLTLLFHFYLLHLLQVADHIRPFKFPFLGL
jgi:hypothetical protein